MLANYRVATIRDQAESVAEQLSNELNGIHANFESFLKEATTGGDGKDQFSDYLRHGLWQLAEHKLIFHRPHTNLGNGADDTEEEARKREDVETVGVGDANYRFKKFENDDVDRVNKAYSDCVASVDVAEPGGAARLCDVYRNISSKLELKSNLFGICDFAKEDTGAPWTAVPTDKPSEHCCPFDKSYCTDEQDYKARARVLENLKIFARPRLSRGKYAKEIPTAGR